MYSMMNAHIYDITHHNIIKCHHQSNSLSKEGEMLMLIADGALHQFNNIQLNHIQLNNIQLNHSEENKKRVNERNKEICQNECLKHF